MTTTRVSTWIPAALCVAALLLAMPVRAAGAGNGGGHAGLGNGQPGQRIEQALERISERIQKVQEGLANHPNSPPEVRTAAEKLVTDLNAAKAALAKAKAALQGRDRAAIQGLLADLKAQHETIRADFEALKSAVETARQQLGRGGQHGNPKALLGKPKDTQAL